MRLAAVQTGASTYEYATVLSRHVSNNKITLRCTRIPEMGISFGNPVILRLFVIVSFLSKPCGPDSSVGIATGYGLDDQGIESRWGARFSTPVQTGPGAHPASCTMGSGSFPGVKSGRGVTLTPHSPSNAVVMKG